MKRIGIAGAAALVILGAGLAEARPGDRLRERIAKRLEQRAEGSAKRERAPGAQTFSYGPDPLQVMDFWAPAGAKNAPLVLYVHGGGWKRGSKDTAMGNALPGHLRDQGYAFASINYRLVPAATVEQQASDVAQALAYLLARADKLGIDRSKVVITGHSAGAHLVALVGTDEQYLRKAGLSFADINGVMPNDGAAYDVPQQMEQAGRMMADTYKQAFGTDPARQKALSPTYHAAAPTPRASSSSTSSARTAWHRRRNSARC
ncbi:alpha/beta fold hydrolase [Novosphingobium sp. THN1]|uniref:alpha/beta fold hydrolase n=1 Tax=Novosphingobium sp. THN1 TaxID=1016987 RepID=UPI0035168BC6